ncbi:MAG: type I-U CRISPR-associated helicase/endonuclease Cas3 [Geminicoccaceae bacterium]|nr:type I-U CRISPR-associated helicase/endonuclease Cas3 [Geminicoccaceae bacterium]
MTADLAVEDFDAFFEEVHGVAPFPWQRRLARLLAQGGAWPKVLDLPTGTGKTAALDIALFHLALEAGRGAHRRAPVRIVLVVDRRLVVDDAFGRAKRLERALAEAPAGTVRARVAARLRDLAIDGPPLVAARLRGGLPREEDWARLPVQPTILCSTVDQVGSRLLFRGYGVSDSMKPVHAGLLGSDCLILLDEAHLAEPFRQTLERIERYRREPWRREPSAGPWGVALLTATPGTSPEDAFGLDDEDRAHPVLEKRLRARKPARLVEFGKASEKPSLHERAEEVVREVRLALERLKKGGIERPAVAVVVNRVARARASFDAIRKAFSNEPLDVLLLIGPQRGVERDRIVERLAPLRTGAPRDLERPLVIVSTQGIEAGVDLDLDGLVTELAPLDSLRQRFGRLNRAGRPIEPVAVILAHAADRSQRSDDPVYGKSLAAAWAQLDEAASGRKRERSVEFGIDDCRIELVPEALAPKADAPVLLPVHLDLLSQTAPVPAQDPPVALFLRGPDLEPDAVTVVWRGDIDPEAIDDQATSRLLELVPPRAGEAIELPVWAVRAGLAREMGRLEALADSAGRPDGEEQRGSPREEQRVFRWRGREGNSSWIGLREIRPGDTIVVPAAHGGLDPWGWNPEAREPVADVAADAAEPFAGRRFAVRVAPGLLGNVLPPERLAETLSASEGEGWRDLRDALSTLPLPEGLRENLARLDRARRGRVVYDLDLYGRDTEGRPRGVMFLAPLGLEGAAAAGEASSEDDLVGSAAGVPVELAWHLDAVAELARQIAERAGLSPSLVAALGHAGRRHDLGKVDPRFQAWLREDDPLGVEPDEPAPLLAKSGRRPARPAATTGLPEHWRHEALSVRLLFASGDCEKVEDPALLLWLVGTHHGYGRPFFPHADPADGTARTLPRPEGGKVCLAAGPGPQSLAFDWRGRDWATLFAELRARYGVWELARLEAILRLADHRVSERERFEGPAP